jgi:hypothetical protein
MTSDKYVAYFGKVLMTVIELRPIIFAKTHAEVHESNISVVLISKRRTRNQLPTLL